MKVVYYSTAFHASHGGSNHSRQFFKEAAAHALVREMLLFPPHPPQTTAPGPERRGMRTVIRRLPLLQVLFFYRRNTFYFRQLVEFLRIQRPDAIVMRLDSNFLQVRKLKRLFPALVVATEVNASPFDESFQNIAFKRHFRKLERNVLSVADLNFFVSDNLAQGIMRKQFRSGRDKIAHNGVDPGVFRQTDGSLVRHHLGIDDEAVVLGYIGTLDVHKSIDVLLSSFKMAADEFPALRLVIVGDGPAHASLRAMSQQLGIDSRTVFTGLRPHAEIPGYVTSFDIAVHHKAGEYMSPLKIFEYLACGVPVIGPSTPAVREVFRDGEHLLTCDGTAEDLTAKIRMLLQDESLRRRLAAAGQRLVSGRYTWKANADLIISNISEKILHP